jgi:hypothetical protein
MYPDAAPTMQQLFKVLCDIDNLANSTPISVGERREWPAITNSAEDNRENYCKVLRVKTPFSVLYGTYTVMLHDLIKVLKGSTQQVDYFKEVCSRKRQCNEEAVQIMKKAVLPASTVTVATENFFTPPPDNQHGH